MDVPGYESFGKNHDEFQMSVIALIPFEESALDPLEWSGGKIDVLAPLLDRQKQVTVDIILMLLVTVTWVILLLYRRFDIPWNLTQ